jgi:hypothetical protein
MGLLIVAMGLLGAVMAPLQAASLLVVPSLVTTYGKWSPVPICASVEGFATMMLMVCVGASGYRPAHWRVHADRHGALGAVLASTPSSVVRAACSRAPQV